MIGPIVGENKTKQNKMTELYKKITPLPTRFYKCDITAKIKD